MIRAISPATAHLPAINQKATAKRKATVDRPQQPKPQLQSLPPRIQANLQAANQRRHLRCPDFWTIEGRGLRVIAIRLKGAKGMGTLKPPL
jgi:hypothetical protein